jgi:CubicO group peptidase (beta-lactamase class C family)
MNAFRPIVMLAFLVTSGGSTTAGASPPPSRAETTATKVDSLLAMYDEPGSPGAAVAVVSQGRVVYMRGRGLANLEYGIPVTPETVFDAASLSKQFTAFAIVLLVQRGDLDLDEDIRTYIPDVPDFGEMITLRHLIHHTSGLRGTLNSLAMAGWKVGDVVSREQIMKMIRSQRELNYRPGDEYLYVNTGYLLMVEIVERVMGQAFDEWTKTHIFAPLGMNNTFFHADFEQVVPNRAYSYHESEEDSGAFKKSLNNIYFVGPSGLLTTVADLVKWVRNFDDARLGGRGAIEQMHERGVLNNGETLPYSYGQFISEYRGMDRISHEGSIAGFRTCIARFPDQALAIIVLSNAAFTRPGRLASRIADLYLTEGSEEAADSVVDEITVDPAIYDDYAGRYELQGDDIMPAGGIVLIRTEDTKLLIRPTGIPEDELSPLSETSFRVAGEGVTVSFERNRSGAVSGLVVRFRDGVQHAIKMKPYRPREEQLSDYAGDYYSDELDTTYTIEVADDRLLATHRSNEAISLTPVEPDAFEGDAWFLRQLQFTRADTGRVVGLIATSGRVRNMRFEKRPR